MKRKCNTVGEPPQKTISGGDRDHPAHPAASADGDFVPLFGADYVIELPAGRATAVLAEPAPVKFVVREPRAVAKSTKYTVLAGAEGLAVVDATTGKARTHTQFGHLEGVAISLRGTEVYVVDTGNRHVCRMDIESGELTVVCAGIVEPRGIALSADGTFAVVACSVANYKELQVARVDLHTGAVSWPFRKCRGIGPVMGVALSRDGKFMYVTGTDHRAIVRVDLCTCECVDVHKHDRGFFGVSVAPDGSYLVATTWGAHGLITRVSLHSTAPVARPVVRDVVAGPVTGPVAGPVVRDVVAGPETAPLQAASGENASTLADSGGAGAAVAGGLASAGPTAQETTECAKEHKLACRAMARARRQHGVGSAQYVDRVERMRRAEAWMAAVRAGIQRHHPALVAVLSARGTQLR